MTDIRIDKVVALVRRHDSDADTVQIRRWVRAGSFPAPVARINAKITLWSRETIEQWLAEKFGSDREGIPVGSAA